ncbi:hypothetical protein THAOC_31848 [Thalassiosira oceanica]|uniref:Uncharacterized protein n=1 Tax=Thalassiosira oceanica TaxID=159749 RepID=K0RK85_THAOC|nr:hypothetical protein THAOC_31848 [Thalassiosira oceanica]|eukprot:EJK49296.1 hypothetical protein THAOC_31848 [Thalassiosira oceanica]
MTSSSGWLQRWLVLKELSNYQNIKQQQLVSVWSFISQEEELPLGSQETCFLASSGGQCWQGGQLVRDLGHRVSRRVTLDLKLPGKKKVVCSAAPRTRALEVGSPAEHARLCRLRYSAHTAVRAPYTLLVARSKMNDRGWGGEIEPRTTGRRPAYLCSVQKKTVQTRPRRRRDGCVVPVNGYAIAFIGCMTSLEAQQIGGIAGN